MNFFKNEHQPYFKTNAVSRLKIDPDTAFILNFSRHLQYPLIQFLFLRLYRSKIRYFHRLTSRYTITRRNADQTSQSTIADTCTLLIRVFYSTIPAVVYPCFFNMEAIVSLPGAINALE